MFFIIGLGERKTKVKGGLLIRKQCPRCRVLSDMEEHRLRQYISFFFIPVIPISAGESIMVCKRCNTAFYMQTDSFNGASNTDAEQLPIQPVSDNRMEIICSFCGARVVVDITNSKKVQINCPMCKKSYELSIPDQRDP